MKIIEGQSYLGCIKFDSKFSKAPLFSQIREEIATRDEFHDKVDSIRSLKDVRH